MIIVHSSRRARVGTAGSDAADSCLRPRFDNAARGWCGGLRRSCPSATRLRIEGGTLQVDCRNRSRLCDLEASRHMWQAVGHGQMPSRNSGVRYVALMDTRMPNMKRSFHYILNCGILNHARPPGLFSSPYRGPGRLRRASKPTGSTARPSQETLGVSKTVAWRILRASAPPPAPAIPSSAGAIPCSRPSAPLQSTGAYEHEIRRRGRLDSIWLSFLMPPAPATSRSPPKAAPPSSPAPASANCRPASSSPPPGLSSTSPAPRTFWEVRRCRLRPAERLRGRE